LQFSLSKVAFERQELSKAIRLAKDAFEIQNRMRLDDFSAGGSACVLACYQEQMGNLDQAKKYFQKSLELLGQARQIKLAFPDSDPIAASRVVAAERLANLDFRSRNQKTVLGLRKLAQSVRAKHPGWSISKNHDPKRFYIICGHFPFATDAIPRQTAVRLD